MPSVKALQYGEKGFLEKDVLYCFSYSVPTVTLPKCLVLGVLTGYNTLSMAMTLPPDGKVVACEVTDKYMNNVNSQQYFKEVRIVSIAIV